MRLTLAIRLLFLLPILVTGIAEVPAQENNADAASEEERSTILAKSEHMVIEAVFKEESLDTVPQRSEGIDVVTTDLATHQRVTIYQTGKFSNQTRRPSFSESRLLGVVEHTIGTTTRLYLLGYNTQRRILDRPPMPYPPDGTPAPEFFRLMAVNLETGKVDVHHRFSFKDQEGTIHLPPDARLPRDLPADTTGPGLLTNSEQGIEVFHCTLILGEDGKVQRVVGPDD